jgi:glycosyltransferase involved in cell wall biosynthesis
MVSRIWTINGDFVMLRPTGVPRYAREVTIALDQLISEGHPLTDGLALDLVVPRPVQDLRLRNVPIRVLPEYNKPRLPQLWVQAQLPRHVKGGLLSFCNLAPVFVTPHIVCIHDLYSWTNPESFSLGFRVAHRVIQPLLGRRVNRITTVSELSRDQIIRYGVASSDKITVTYNGADHALRWTAARSTLQLGDRPFVLCIGRGEKHKNMELIWRIAPALGEMGLDIYMAGDISNETLGSYGGETPRNLRLLGRISDDDLAKAFEMALGFLFPSRIEGFGLPAIEAMIWGCPVIAANAPCLPEVLGEAALYAGPDDAEGWVETIDRLRSDPALQREMSVRSRMRAARFTWRGIAESYLRLMADIDEGTS